MAVYGQAASAVDPLVVAGHIGPRPGGWLQLAAEIAQPPPNDVRSRVHPSTGRPGQAFLQALARNLPGAQPGDSLRRGRVFVACHHARQRLSLSDLSPGMARNQLIFKIGD